MQWIFTMIILLNHIYHIYSSCGDWIYQSKIQISSGRYVGRNSRNHWSTSWQPLPLVNTRASIPPPSSEGSGAELLSFFLLPRFDLAQDIWTYVWSQKMAPNTLISVVDMNECVLKSYSLHINPRALVDSDEILIISVHRSQCLVGVVVLMIKPVPGIPYEGLIYN